MRLHEVTSQLFFNDVLDRLYSGICPGGEEQTRSQEWRTLELEIVGPLHLPGQIRIEHGHANTPTHPHSKTELELPHTYCGVFPQTRKNFTLQDTRGHQFEQLISSHFIFSSI